MSYDVQNISSENAGIVMYRSVEDTIRTHFAATNGAGAFLEAPLQAYYGMQDSIFTQSLIFFIYNYCPTTILHHYIDQLFLASICS